MCREDSKATTSATTSALRPVGQVRGVTWYQVKSQKGFWNEHIHTCLERPVAR
jgi:hypothetical protein